MAEGIQTDVYRPDVGGIGKGCIFSTWWTFDATDTRPESDGFIQLGTHEGRFVGVRRAYEWGVGDYRLTLARADPEGDGDWFAMSIQPIGPVVTPGVRPLPTGPVAPLGALRFRRANPDRPATISPAGPAFIEVYSNAATYADIDDWSLDLMAYGDGRRAVTARSEYPAFPYAVVPNVDVSYAAPRERVAIAVRPHDRPPAPRIHPVLTRGPDQPTAPTNPRLDQQDHPCGVLVAPGRRNRTRSAAEAIRSAGPSVQRRS